jgi:hypothetical protein
MICVAQENKKSVERRKLKRFKAPAGSFVAIGSGRTMLGEIVDVSTGGLGFHYIDKERLNRSHLDMFFTEHDLFFSDVPFNIVSDSEIKVFCRVIEGAHSRFMVVRRCGGQFVDLTHSQTSQLEYLIQKCTAGEV